jgi:hypothetical protein
MKNKRCITCKQVKALTEFPKDGATNDGHRPKCRDCMAARRKALYSKEAEAAKYRRTGAKNRGKINASRNLKLYLRTKLCGTVDLIATRKYVELGVNLKSLEKWNVRKREIIKADVEKNYAKDNLIRNRLVKSRAFSNKLNFSNNKHALRLLIQKNYPDNLKKIKNYRQSTVGTEVKATGYMLAQLTLTHRAVSVNNILHASCKLCGKLFKPTRSQTTNALLSIRTIGSYYNLYCSDGCRRSCTLTHLKPVDFASGLLKLWADSVKDRDGHTCQICDSLQYPQAHHIKPKATNPLLAYDLENGITLCRTCHMTKVHVDECSTHAISQRSCKAKHSRKEFKHTLTKNRRNIFYTALKWRNSEQKKKTLRDTNIADLSAMFLAFTRNKSPRALNNKFEHLINQSNNVMRRTTLNWLNGQDKNGLTRNADTYNTFMNNPDVKAFRSKPKRY